MTNNKQRAVNGPAPTDCFGSLHGGLKMSKRIVNKTLSAAIVAALYAGTGYAQQAPATKIAELETVVVTGSYIRGTPTDAALPVDVITSDDLAAQGSPTVVQLVKTITASQASIGESNRYNGGAGTASINLRGFGASRTLTLFNGRRLADSPLAAFQGGGANLNFIPQAAVGRVEILKDGAAATYGSDAIGGVVNFISRTDLNGLELNGQYSHISGSDGDYEGSAAWGAKMTGGNILITGSYRHRSRLDIHERSWAIQPFESPFFGGWTGAGNPGIYVANTPTLTTTTIFRDNGCTELGGVINGGVCRFQFSNFNDLVNEEDHYQLHAEFNASIGDTIQSHTELTWGRDYVPEQRLSPANLTTQFPTPTSMGGASGSLAPPGALNYFVRYNIPAYNPGLVDLRTTCPPPLTAAQCTAMGSANGIDASPTSWRAIAHAGHPTNPDKADHQVIDNKAFRVSTGLKGEFAGIDWDTALTYMSAHSAVSTNDLLVNQIQNGLNGLLSLPGAADQCTPQDVAALQALGAAQTAADHAARGCYFFNPFTNSVAVSAVNNQANPFYRGTANPAVINNPQVIETLYGNFVNESTNNLFVFDAVFSGKTGLTLMATDPVGWALGTQYRYTENKAEYGDLFNNKVTPCVDSINRQGPVCQAPNGPLEFFGSNSNSDSTQGVYALFGELNMPITDSFSAGLAARYESYPGNIGSTFNPKLSLRWQALDWLAFRGSAGTTFRAPPAALVVPGCVTGVANINGSYRAVETCGNPDLRPETANAYNFGILLKPGNFTSSVDYFLFNFDKEITAESASQLFASMFPTVAGHCGEAAFAPLEARFSFAGGCSRDNAVRVKSFNVNGPGTNTSGLDIRMQYDWPQLMGGSLSVGLDATYLLKLDRGAFTLKDAPSITFAAPEDRAGKHDLVSQFFSNPKLKGNVFISYKLNDFVFRLQNRYSQGTEAAFGTANTGKLKDFWQHDLIAQWHAPMDLTVGLTIQNILNTDPPDAPSQFNYDYTSGNPLGRVFEVSLKKKF